MRRRNVFGKLSIRVLAGLVALACFAVLTPVDAHEQTIGVFLNEEGAFDGYTLFAANRYETTYLIDNEGRLVNSWDTGFITGPGSYLLEDGSMIRPDGQGGLVRRFSWEGDLLWEYRYRGANYVRHHDIEVLPNGNVLMIARIVRTGDEAVEAGRDPASLLEGELWSDHIVEIEPVGDFGGNIVWEWYPWDHLIQDIDQTKDNMEW